MKNIALSLILGAGLTIFTGAAFARTHYTSTDISNAEQQLQASGYYKGPIDGRYNHKMVNALMDYQIDNDLNETGALNHKTCDALHISCGTSGTTTTSTSTTR